MNNKDSKLVEELKKYFNNTPKDILEAEWDEINSRYSDNCITVEEWLEYNKENIKRAKANGSK